MEISRSLARSKRCWRSEAGRFSHWILGISRRRSCGPTLPEASWFSPGLSIVGNDRLGKKLGLALLIRSDTVADEVHECTILADPARIGDIVNLARNLVRKTTPSPKGHAWRKVIYGSVGVLASQEQAAALRALAAQRKFIDLDRVGVWGWSGGGSMTDNLMFRSTDLHKVGVAVAAVPDQRLYDSIYQERYMGLPDSNAKGYHDGSPISYAEGLKGKLLIMHGTGDDNVHFQGDQRLINRLVELGKQFDFMEYPNRTHGISEGRGTSLHVHTKIAGYFEEYLPAGGR
jgi:dienelactone hydrolase